MQQLGGDKRCFTPTRVAVPRRPASAAPTSASRGGGSCTTGSTAWPTSDGGGCSQRLCTTPGAMQPPSVLQQSMLLSARGVSSSGGSAYGGLASRCGEGSRAHPPRQASPASSG